MRTVPAVDFLEVPAATYTVIDGTSIKQTNVRFAEGTDVGKWSFLLEGSLGDLVWDFRP